MGIVKRRTKKVTPHAAFDPETSRAVNRNLIRSAVPCYAGERPIQWYCYKSNVTLFFKTTPL